MSVRIVATQGPAGTTLAVSGRLVGPWVAELAGAFEAAAGGAGGAVIVELSDLAFAAGEGIDLLRGFVARGAVVRGCPPYLLAQLEGTP